MALLGKNYVSYVNKTYRRSGTLWEGRHKGSLIEGSRYLLACLRYIELNPVRARIVDEPGKYAWRSYRTNADGMYSEFVTPHSEYVALGQDTPSRHAAYKRLFEDSVPDTKADELRVAAHFNHPLGDDRFKAQIEKTLQRQIGSGTHGRPRKKRTKTETSDSR